MHRKNQEIIKPDELLDIVRRCRVCRIGLCDSGTPYVVPVCFGFQDNTLYFHSGPHGKKLDILRRNNRVCLEMETDVNPVPHETACQWTMHYRSIIGQGSATIVDDFQQKAAALRLIMKQYSNTDAHEFPPAMIGKTTIVRVDIEKMTGKQNGYPATGNSR